MVTKKDYLVPLLKIVTLKTDVITTSGQTALGTDDVAEYKWGGYFGD